MNRRSFLGGLGAIAAGTSVKAASTDTTKDEFVYRGYTVRWSGWRESPQQMLYYGYWFASMDGCPPIIYATTLGSLGVLKHEAEVMDLTNTPRDRSWLTKFSASDVLQARKLEIGAMLLRKIDDAV